MQYAAYVEVPPGDDGDLIARATIDAATPDYDFSVREKSDPSESAVEICFRIRGVSHPDEALSKALELYELGRTRAGLDPDRNARVSLQALADPGSDGGE